MTVLEISILLHYYWSPIDYQQHVGSPQGNSPATAEVHRMLLSEELLQSRYTDLNWAVDIAPFVESYNGSPVERPIFSLTDKGRAMVDHLRAVKIPICQWVQPS